MTMKIEHEVTPERVGLCKMPSGSVGVTSDGYYYYKTSAYVVCLNAPGKSYSHPGESPMVKLLPAGSQLWITVMDGNHSTVEEIEEEEG